MQPRLLLQVRQVHRTKQRFDLKALLFRGTEVFHLHVGETLDEINLQEFLAAFKHMAKAMGWAHAVDSGRSTHD